MSGAIDSGSKEPCIGLIAGSGILPELIVQAVRKQLSCRVVIVAHRDETDPGIAELADSVEWVRLGQFKKALAFLQRQRVTDAVFAGGITKVKIWSARPDTLALKLILRLRHLHDDLLLRAIAGEVEKLGITVKAVKEFVPDLLSPTGVLTKRHPTPEEWQEILFGWEAAKGLGRLDIGQGVVVHRKIVVAVEAIEGTDAMIARAGGLISKDGVLVKVAKPGQDHRLDLPATGSRTVRGMHEAGISVLALEAGSSMMLDPDTMLQEANRYGIAIVGIKADCDDQAIIDEQMTAC
ncbi:MAG: UDP-2,3-diacylglucosamine diphosphatase LpxI [Magnetococcales bacterium]|nr:UDP-2,3-diacylglucosamine diphosphatase LpxI [Magnetococcales bacterium]